MLYILYGQDDFSLRQSLEEIKHGIGDVTLLTVNTTALDGQSMTIDQLRNACETAPFLAEKRLVVVDGLLNRFETEAKTGRKKKTAKTAGRKNNYEELVGCIGNMPDSTVLVLVDGRITGKNPLLRELTGHAEVKFFPLLSDARLRQWVQNRVAERGGSISAHAVDSLARLVGGNLWIMTGEIDKLVLFTAGRSIEEEDVRAMVSCTQEANVFVMVDAILEFKAGVAGQLLQQLLQGGAAPAYLLVMLSRQVQMVVRAKDLRSQRKPRAEIQSRLGLASDFVLRKTLEQAERYPWPRLRDIYRLLLETDLAIKLGKYNDDLAMTILVAELCQRR